VSISSTGIGELGPLVVKPKVAWKLLACSNTRGYELIAAGELESFRDGRSRKITIASIHRFIARRLGAEKAPRAAREAPRRRGRPRKHLAGGERFGS
jgi:excisionase family DNA binding protein